jgi:creatinine amidohydrolase/Fe(II)-dependent formamide hydrolase-like protein
MAVHVLATMTWTEVRALTAGRTVAILPTGAVEAHGPHLPLGTDIVIAEAMARAGAARLAARNFDAAPPRAVARSGALRGGVPRHHPHTRRSDDDDGDGGGAQFR